MIRIILGAIILGYTVFVIYRKLKIKMDGKTCSSGCASCPSKGKCNNFNIFKN